MSIERTLQKALDDIGTEIVPCPKTTSNSDPLIHEYFISKRSESYFKKRATNAKNILKKNGLLEDLPDPGGNVVLVSGEVYNLNAKVNQPATSLDENKLLTVLTVQFKLSFEDARRVIDNCKVERAPAVIIEAVPHNIS